MKLNVYIVDDDRHYAKLLSYRLEKLPDVEVTIFNSGERLLAEWSEPPDLILLDIMMPGMSGIEVLRHLKSLDSRIPILVISAQGVYANSAEAIRLGAYDYITKGEDDLLRLNLIVQHIRERRALEHEVERLRQEVQRLSGGGAAATPD